MTEPSKASAGALKGVEAKAGAGSISGEAGAGDPVDQKDISVLLTPAGRLEITANVDANGLTTLKKMLDKYEEILKMLS